MVAKTVVRWLKGKTALRFSPVKGSANFHVAITANF